MSKRHKAANIQDALQHGKVVPKRPSRKHVAEKSEQSNAKSALLPPENQEELPMDSGNSASKEKPMAEAVTFKHKSTQKNGIHTYSAEGYGGSIYINKSLFAGDPNAEITVSANFVKGANRGGGARAVSPERAAKAQEKLQKQEERLKKAQERIEKQRELAARLNKALGTEQPA